MQNRTLIKSALVALFVLLVTSCSSTSEKVAEQTATPVDSTDRGAAEQQTVWQNAYGEKQPTLANTSPSSANPLSTQRLSSQPEPITDLWQRIPDGFEISDYQQLHPDSEQQLRWFITHPDYVSRVVERARPYLHYIVEQIEIRGMPMEIALLPVVESGFQPYAYSSSHAAGLWQFIPGTGKLYGLDQNWWYDGRRDVIQSTRAALDYLQKLHNDFGDWQLALAAYNCGEGTVGRAIKRNRQLGKPTDFWSLDLPAETSAYVPKLMAVSHMVKFPERYDLSLSPIDNEPYLDVINVGSQIDMAMAAKMAGISSDEMYTLNPAFNRWATAPDGPHDLVVPLSKAEIFKSALAALPAKQRVKWARHQIKRGESLSVIARRYETTVAVIRQANELQSSNIRAGSHLLIPVAAGDNKDYALMPAQAQARSQSTNKSQKKYHIVRSGDTWWDIARSHDLDVKTLAQWNNKAPGDILQPGQKLVILTDNASSNSAKRKTVSYVIKNGDSLWAISRKFNVSVAQVREWNGLSDRTLLQPGQNLKLYLDET